MNLPFSPSRRTGLAVLAAACSLAAGGALAAFPDKQVRIVVP